MNAPAPQQKFPVAIIVCGRMGQDYADVYKVCPKPKSWPLRNGTRSGAVLWGKRYDVNAFYRDVDDLLKEIVRI